MGIRLRIWRAASSLQQYHQQQQHRCSRKSKGKLGLKSQRGLWGSKHNHKPSHRLANSKQQQQQLKPSLNDRVGQRQQQLEAAKWKILPRDKKLWLDISDCIQAQGVTSLVVLVQMRKPYSALGRVGRGGNC
jgi:hypothetical protein